MKRYVFLFTLLLSIGACFPALGQEAPRPDRIKYWIFFSDRGEAGKAPAIQPSPRALRRRALRGRTVATELDRPPAPAYVAALREHGVEPLVESRWLNAVSAYLDEEAYAHVRALPFVRGVKPVGRMTPDLHAPPALPVVWALKPRSTPAVRRLDYGASETQLALVNAIPPLERGLNGSGVRLGVIDTGIGNLSTHPAFTRLLAEGRLIESRDFTGQPDDLNRHGRAVLSVAAGFDEGNLIGPGYGAEVLHARTEYAPTETNQEEDNFVAGLEWMEAEGVDVVNVSLGYSEFDAGQHSYTVDDMDGDTAVTTRAADLAAQLGVVMVTSAGNAGNSAWRIITSPADGDSVITVGAVDSQGVRASFSSVGPTADGRIKPDVAAMGVGVWLATSGSGYTLSDGTSFSSPMVAGVVAQLLQVNPALTPMEVRELLRSTASQAEQPDNFLGWGIIDADAAITRAEALATSAERQERSEPTISVALYPNPTAERARFEIRTAAPVSRARLEVFDVLGRRLLSRRLKALPAGKSLVTIDTGTWAPGVYFYTVQVDAQTLRGNLIVVR